jgi:hypothetical protein
VANSLDVVVRFVGDATGAVQAANKTEQAYGGLANKLTKTGLALSAAVTLPLALAGKAALNELENAGKVAAQTTAVIKSTGGAAGVSAKQVDDLATSLMKKSGTDDEAIKSGENLLLTFTKIHNQAGKGNDIFTQATKAALDLSVAFGKDMADSSVLVGKALQDPIKGITALQRVGVQLSDQQKQQIKDFMAVGDVASAQKVILKELQTQVGGSADAFGKTLPGQIAIAKESLMNAAGSIVAVFAPALSLAAKLAGGLAGFLSDLPAPLQAAVGGFALLAAGVGPAMTVVGNLMKVAGPLKSAFESAQVGVMLFADSLKAMSATSLVSLGAIGLLAAGVAAFVAWSVLSKSSSEQAADAGKKWAQVQVENAKAAGDTAAQIKDLQATHASLGARLADATAMQERYLKAGQDVTLAQKEFGISTAEAQQRARDLAPEIAGLQSKYDTLGPAIANLKREQQLATVTAEAQRSANDELAASSQGVASANESQLQSISKLNSAYLAAQGGPLAYEAAQLQVEQAQKRVDDLIAGGSLPTSFEYRQATNDLAQAKLGAANAAFTMQKSDADLANLIKTEGVGGLIAYRDSLVRTALAHGDNTGAITGEVAKVNELIDRAKASDTTHTVTMIADTASAVTAITGLDAMAKATAATPHTIKFLTSVEGALAGQVKGAMAGLVVPGYRGAPQLIVAHGGERIVPAYKAGTGGGTAGFGASGGGGDGATFNITVQVPVGANPAAVGAATVDAIRSYERVAGKSWRN